MTRKRYHIACLAGKLCLISRYYDAIIYHHQVIFQLWARMTFARSIRVVKKLTMNDKILISRLEEWGDVTEAPLDGIGYPTQTNEARMMELRAVSRSGNKPTSFVPNYKAHPQVKEIDMILEPIRRHKYKVKWYKALRAKYIKRLKPTEATSYCDCAERTYYERVEKGEDYVRRGLGL